MSTKSHCYEDEDGEVRLSRRFVGKYRPDMPRNTDHAEGFDIALRKALDAADRAYEAGVSQIPGAPTTFRVSVTFEAEVVVQSPGNVGEYKAIVNEL
jgi:hypothetical protein